MTSLNKFVVRLLTEADELLAWAEVYAEPRPQPPPRGASCPWFPVWPTQFRIDRDGIAAKIAVHWCDLDIARVQAILEPSPVSVGQVHRLTWIEPIWLVQGMREVPLPTVTVHQSMALVVPAGTLTAAGVSNGK